MGLSLPHLLILALVVLVLFGGGRISGLMGDVGKGIKSFKKGITDEDEPKPAPRIDAPSEVVIDAEKQTDKQA